MTNKKEKTTPHRLTDKEFWSILKANAGLYQRTATAIEKKFNRPYTRQSVKERAEKHPERLAEIKEATIDTAEGGLLGLMGSTNEGIRLKAITYYLDNQGKKRGYVKQVNAALVNRDGEDISFASLLMKAGAESEQKDEGEE